MSEVCASIGIFPFAGPPPSNDVLFLGDYSLEVVGILFTLRILFPEHIFLIHGNRESESVNGFREDWHTRYWLLSLSRR
jgi:serine/threonine-protein phosphatase PP1 catalytic subunit